jgi:hypothetical protein
MRRVRGRARVTAAIGLLGLAGVLTTSPVAQATTDQVPGDEFGQNFDGVFDAGAEAYAVRFVFNIPKYLVVDPVLQVTVPRAFASVDSGPAALGESAYLDLGPVQYITEAAVPLIASNVGTSAPIVGPLIPPELVPDTGIDVVSILKALGVPTGLPYPALASSHDGEGPARSDLFLDSGLGGSAATADASAGFTSATSAASLYSVTLPTPPGLGGTTTTGADSSSAAVSARAAASGPSSGSDASTASSSALARGIDIAGVVTIDAVETFATATAGSEPTAGVKLTGMKVAGTPVYVDESGVHVETAKVGDQRLATDQVNAALKAARMEIIPGEVLKSEDGTTIAVEGLIVRWMFDLQGLVTSKDNYAEFHIGYAAAGADLEMFGADAAPADGAVDVGDSGLGSLDGGIGVDVSAPSLGDSPFPELGDVALPDLGPGTDSAPQVSDATGNAGRPAGAPVALLGLGPAAASKVDGVALLLLVFVLIGAGSQAFLMRRQPSA